MSASDNSMNPDAAGRGGETEASRRIPPVNVHSEAFDPARTHTVIFQPSGRRGTIREGQTLLEAARQLGVGIESICGGRQTCSKCYVRIESGWYSKHGVESTEGHVTPPGERETYYRQKRKLPEGIRYSCDACVIGDVLVTVPDESQSQKQIIRKTARAQAITLNPTVRKYYVEISEPTMHANKGDAETVIAELVSRFPELDTLTFDYPALRDLQSALRRGNWGVSLTIWNEREVIRVEPGYHEQVVGLAVDIGTTSVAAYLCDLRTGDVLATEAAMNPQVSYGEDLMSRVSYAIEEEEGLQRLHQTLIKGLNDLATGAASQVGLDASEIVDVVFVGNSAIHHLVLGFDPRYLGLAPFVPAADSAIDMHARDLGLNAVNAGAYVHFLPLEAGFVGADNVGVIVAEEPHKQDDIMLIIDIGTNGEIVLGNKERLLCASSPTGPALEGAEITFGMRAASGAIERVRIDHDTLEARFRIIGQDKWSDELPSQTVRARGICGSGIIEVVAELWKAGVVDSSGRWNTSLEHPRLVEHVGFPAYILAWSDQTSLQEPILVTVADVRAIQLAKAALYTGARILMRHLGVDTVDRIILAGAFGSHIDPERAMTIGMIPDCNLEDVHAVGNAAGDGARIALFNRDRRAEAVQIARSVEHITMPLEGDFQDIFMHALAFPNEVDPFPHLEPILRKVMVREKSS